MTLDEIKALLELFNASGVGELEVERKDARVRISRAVPVSQDPLATSRPPVISVLSGAESTPAAVPVAHSHAQAGAAPAPEPDAQQILVKSPIVGTYYDSPSPEAGPFVKVGDSVEPGQVLCIIESMKLMNEIPAEVAGTIARKLVENGKPVEYGQGLFSILPLG